MGTGERKKNSSEENAIFLTPENAISGPFRALKNSNSGINRSSHIPAIPTILLFAVTFWSKLLALKSLKTLTKRIQHIKKGYM